VPIATAGRKVIGTSINEIHDERTRSAALLKAVDLREVRMIECGKDPGFAPRLRS
jgi:hypothetical protein